MPLNAHMLLRIKKNPRPKKLNIYSKINLENREWLCFAMKSLPCLKAIRKKIPKYKGIRRGALLKSDPSLDVARMRMKLESQITRPKSLFGGKSRAAAISTSEAAKKGARLQKLITDITVVTVKRKSSKPPLVQIQPWSGRQENQQRKAANSKSSLAAAAASSAPTPAVHYPMNPHGQHQHAFPNPSGQVTKIKSELCPVTETCTSATLQSSSPSQSSRSSNKSKASTTPSASGASSSSDHHRHPASLEGSPVSRRASGHHSFSGGPGLPANAKTMPITATMARIKSEQPPSSIISSSTLISSPDLQRVRYEIRNDPCNSINQQQPMSISGNPIQGSLDQRDSPHFLSPRKRILHNLEQNAGSPTNKRHRLSTDSRGSAGSSDGGTNSPHLSTRTNSQSPRLGTGSPYHGVAASPPRAPGRISNSFSIDSIMNKEESKFDVKPGLVRPVPLPASPARVNEVKREYQMPPFSPDQEMRSRSPTPASSAAPIPMVSAVRPSTAGKRSPPLVPISPYVPRSAANGSSASSENHYPLNPRLAHLAGVAANPSFGLNPTQSGYAAAAAFNSVINNPLNNPLTNHFYGNLLAASQQQQQQQQQAQQAAAAAAILAGNSHQFAVNLAASQAAAATQLASSMWTPPVATTIGPTMPRAPSPANTLAASVSSSMAATGSSTSVLSSISRQEPNRPFNGMSSPGGWSGGQQYRGEPKVGTPRSIAEESLRRSSRDPGSPGNH